MPSLITDFTRLKVLSYGQESCHGGTAKWTPYTPIEVSGKIRPCLKGLHYCEGIQILDWLNDELWLFEDLAEKRVKNEGGLGKFVTSKGMITERVKSWNLRTMRLFAVDCVAPLCRFSLLEKSLQVARAYANGQTTDEAMWEARKEMMWAGNEKANWLQSAEHLAGLCLSKPIPVADIVARAAQHSDCYVCRERQWELLKGYLNGGSNEN